MDAVNFTVASGANNELFATVDVTAGSTLTITNTTIPTLGTLNAASTVVYNASSAQTISAVTYGNLSYSGSSTGTFAGSCTVAGALTISSGSVIFNNQNSGNRTFTVNNLIISTTGTVDLASANALSTVNVSGNFSKTAGTLTTSDGNGLNGTIVFNGTAQNIACNSSQWVHFTINNGSVCTLTGGFAIGSNNSTTADPIFTVNSGGTLNCGTNNLTGGTGDNIFTLSSGANLRIGSTAGITSSGATGNIQTSTRNFNTGANYIYDNATPLAQATGNGLPATVNNLTINNAAGVTLTAAVTVNAALILTNGNITLGSNNLTIAAAGSVSGGSASSYIKTNSTGQLRRTVAASAVSFPVGNASYNPITLTNSGTSDVYGMRVLDGSFSTNDNTKIINRRWVVTENTSGGSNLAVVAQYNSGEAAAGFNAGTSAYMGFFNGTSWIHRSATQAGADPFTFTSTSNFAPANLTTGTQYFALGKDEAFVLIASQLAVTAITPSSPTAGAPFSVTVQSQNGSNLAANVFANTTFSLSTNGNAGTIGGTITGTIAAGASSATVTAVTLSSPGTGATIAAARTGGDVLTGGTSDAFNVLNPASQLAFVAVPATGTRGVNLTSFTVEARRPDNSLDNTFTGSITISKASGPGTLSGTLTATAVAGVATFNAAYFDLQGTYTLNASSGSLSQATSGGIVISFVSLATDHFRSAVSSGNYAAAGSWESSGDNITFLPATLAPTSSASSILIQSGHTIFATANPSVNNLTVQGTYEHRFNGGNLPIATWATGSTCLVTNVTTTAPGNNGQNFYHFTWASNSTGQRDILSTSSIGGNLTISGGTSGAGNEVRNTATSFTIGGDLIISGNGNMRIGSGTAKTVNVNGNVSITGGTLNMSNGSAIGTLTVKGNFTHTGGTINETSTGSGSITFDGDVMHIYTSGGTLSGVINYTVTSGDTLQMGTGANPAIISNGSIGTFTLSAGATLGITSAAGITATGATGNIQLTGVRIFSTSANYIYNGSTVQSTGNGLPSTINDLTIDNSGGSTGVTLTANLAMTGDLNFVNGLITTNSNTLILSSASVINNASSSTYVNGKLARVFAATGAQIFPVGKGGNYRPVTFEYTALTGTSTVTVEQFESGLITTVAPPARRLGSRYWNISQSGALAAQYKVTLDKTGLTQDGSSTVVMIKSDGGVGASAAATNADPLYTNVADYNSLTATASSFMLGENNIPTTTVVSSIADITYGTTTPVLLTATVSSNNGVVTAGGTVTFMVDGNPVGTGITNSSGVATYSYNPSTLSVTGSPHTVTADFAAFDIYAASSGSNSLNITEKALTITANDQVKCEGQTFSFTGTEFTASGLVNGDTVFSVALSSTGAPSAAISGNYTITASTAIGNGLSNYTITYVDGNMLVNSRPTAVISGDATICYGTGTTTVTLNVTGAGTISGQLSDGTYFSGTAPIIHVNVGPFTTTTVITVLSLSDANCTAIGADLTGTATITIPSQLTATAVVDSAIKCNAGTTTVTITGNAGTPPYSGEGTFVVTAGTYNYTITDALGCSATTTITVSEPTLLVVTAVADSAIKCYGGTTTVTVNGSGGTAPYSGEGTFTVSAGTYNYTVTDANGCIAVATVTVGEPAILAATAVADSAIKCNGGTTTVTVSATGGTAPYTGTGVFTATAGTFNYTVVDANGCSTVATVTLGEPSLLGATAVADSAIKCNGGTTTVTVSAAGGTAPYTGTGSFIVAAGTHNFLVKDANGCTIVTTIVVGQPTALVASSTAPAIVCRNGTTTVTVSATGGTAPYTGTGDFVVGPGTYTFTVTDANGCSSNTNITLVNPPVQPLPVPGAISGPVDVCPYVGQPTTATYSIAPVPNALSYYWAVSNGGTIVSGQGTTSVQISYATGFYAGNVSVKANYVCGSSVPRLLALDINVPQMPALIYGPTDVCSYVGTTNNVTYYIKPVQYANGYEWTVPTGAVIISGQGDTLITVNYPNGFISGERVSVRSLSNCFVSAFKSTLPIVTITPARPGAISGPINACPYVGTNTEVTYSIAPVTNATSYFWTVPAGVDIVSDQGDTSIRVKFNNTFISGNIGVSAIANCGSSTERTLAVSRVLPGTPGSISGTTDACPLMGTAATTTYTIRSVLNATSYNWSVPAGASIVSGQGDTAVVVSFSNSFVSGNISVTASNTCATSAARTLAITRRLPATPGNISGPTDPCPYIGTATNVQYSIRQVANAISYNWTVPAGVTIVSGQGDTSILVNFTNAYNTGNISVAAVANCGSSANRTLNLVKKLPTTPGTINAGTPTGCPNRQVVYSIAAVPNATYYYWTVPAGAFIISGDSTTSIVVEYPSGAVSDTVRVRSGSNCSLSPERKLKVTLSACPSMPVAKTNGKITTTSAEVADLSVTVLPNPSTDRFRIVIGYGNGQPVNIVVTDVNGRIQEMKTKLLPGGQITLGEAYKPGLYFMQLVQGRIHKVIKLIKQ